MSNAGLPIKRVRYGTPRSTLSNANICNALKAHVVPLVTKEYQVVAIRCCLDFTDHDIAVKQLAARRRLLEMKLFELDEVSNSHLFIYL